MNKYLEKVAARVAVREMIAKTTSGFIPKAEMDMVKSVRKSQSNMAISKARTMPAQIDQKVSTRKPGFFQRQMDMKQRLAGGPKT